MSSLSALVARAGEQCILPVKSDRSDAALDHVGIDLNAAVVEEARKSVPARERVADCLGEFGLLADQGELGAEPGFEVFNDRPAPGLARGTSLVDAAAANLPFDGIEGPQYVPEPRWRLVTPPAVASL